MKTKTALISLFGLDLGLRYVSAFLKSKNYATHFISFCPLKQPYSVLTCNYISGGFSNNKVYEKDINLLINLLLELKPDIVGISVSSPAFSTAAILTREIKGKLDIPVIWGGIHPTLCPEECIRNADIVCVGEGEAPMYELVERLENKEEITAIKNLWINKDDGSIEKNTLRGLMPVLDSLPYPDFGDAFAVSDKKLTYLPAHSNEYFHYIANEYPMVSARGCYFGCSFCCNNRLRVIYRDQGEYVRRRSPENVIGELLSARKNNVFFRIRFLDDIFASDKDWVERFCQLYIKNISLPFSCFTHPKYADKNMIELLAKAGLVSIYLGVQSGSEDLCRNRYERIQFNKDILECADKLKTLNVDTVYEMILDNPYETVSDYNATIELLLKLAKPYSAHLFSLCYFPKTEFSEQALKDKLITEDAIEGKNNKALSRFHLFIDSSCNRKYLFYYLIIAMISSGLFSERFIGRCRRNNFFRRHPRIFLIFIRVYMKVSLFSPSTIFYFLFNKEKYSKKVGALFKISPRVFLFFLKVCQKMGRFYKDGEALMKFNLIGGILKTHQFTVRDGGRKDRASILLSAKPLASESTSQRLFLLKLKKNTTGLGPAASIKLRMLFCPLAVFPVRNIYKMREVFGYWDISINMDNNETEIKLEIDLLSNRAFLINKGLRQEAVPVKISGQLADKEACVLYFFLFDSLASSYILKDCVILYKDNPLSIIKTL